MIPYELKTRDRSVSELEGMLFKLRDAEQIRHGHIFRTQPRLTISHVMLAVKSGEGRITIEGEERSLSGFSICLQAGPDLWSGDNGYRSSGAVHVPL